MESEEEEGIRKIEEVEEEVYHDAVDEEVKTEEGLKEEEKEEKVESEIEVIKQTGINRKRQNVTRKQYTNNAIRPNDGDKSQTRQATTNELLRRRRAGKGLANYS